MRIRSIKPEFWRDAVTGEMAPDLALFYLGLSCFADDAGRFEWDLRLLRADLDPFDTKFGGVDGIASLLAQLVAAGRVVPYDANGKKHGEIPSFVKHQHPKKPSFRCPEPVRNQFGTGTEPVPAGSGGEVEEEGEAEEEGTTAAAVPDPLVVTAPSAVVAVLPCVGQGAHDYAVTQAEIDAWAPAYPGIDVKVEVLKARAWLEANPAKRKTQSGVQRFLVSWFGRSQDSARSHPKGKPQATAPAEVHTFTGEVRI
jgi:hypothetical protein